MVKLNDKWFRIGGIAFIWLMSMQANKFYAQPFSTQLLLRVLLILLSIAAAWEVNRFLIVRLHKKYLTDGQQAKRIALAFLIGMGFTALILSLTQFLCGAMAQGLSTAWAKFASWKSLEGTLALFVSRPLLFFALLFGTYEALYYYARMRATEKERNRLEKEKVLAELDNLNQQVNPHFLFNTLNALSSVASENPAETDKLLNETSKVYRYLLDNNKHKLVPLRAELSFIRSFFQLLQLRYGAGISLSAPALGSAADDLLLPPLTLQLLVENAVKHNVHCKASPLRIAIVLEEGDRLTVTNNLQRKPQKPVSHRIGLDNIAAKYRLLQQPEPVVTDDGQRFSVSVALLQPQTEPWVLTAAD